MVIGSVGRAEDIGAVKTVHMVLQPQKGVYLKHRDSKAPRSWFKNKKRFENLNCQSKIFHVVRESKQDVCVSGVPICKRKVRNKTNWCSKQFVEASVILSQ